MLQRLRGLLVGGPKNLLDPRIHHSLALVAFFAWVGLGSDGLSSSCYGPEEAFVHLGAHVHLALYLVVAIVSTALLISASYSYIIELFPSGGGGYLVADTLRDPHGAIDEIGMFGVAVIFLRAFSLGGASFTGIEAVSNSTDILREPRVETGKKTMLYMAISLSFTAGGILLCYLLNNVQ